MKRKLPLILFACLCLLLGGCTALQAEQTPSTAAQTPNATTQATASLSESFTDRDYESGYDVLESAVITLNGDSAVCSSDAVEISGSTVTILDEGTYVLSGTLNGSVIVNADKTDKLQLVLDGAEIHSESSAAIYILQADKVFLSLPTGTENTLSNGGVFTAIDDNNIDAVLFSKEDLTLNGTGSLTIRSPVGHGIVSKDDLVITGGSYDITAASHGIAGKDSVRIASGDFKITAGKDGVHAENSDDDTLGTMLISGGSFAIAAEDDGLHASNLLQIDGGTLNITKSCEGIEGLSIAVTGGEISIVASDDGLNAARSNDTSSEAASGEAVGGFGGRNDPFAADDACVISISGGSLRIDASGDGIDTNGALYVSGGEIYLSGPTNSGNGAFDYAQQAEITGGVLVAAGSQGMAMNFSAATQGAALVTVGTQNAGSTITLTDASGTVLLSFTPEKQYESVVVSCPQLVQGGSYTLTAGSYETQLTFESLLLGSGGMGGMPVSPGGGFPGGQPGEPPEGFTGVAPGEPHGGRP